MPNAVGLIGTLLGVLAGIATGMVIYDWMGSGVVAAAAGIGGGLLAAALWGSLAIFLIQSMVDRSESKK